VHRETDIGPQHREKIRGWALERDLEREVIRRTKTDRPKIRDFPARESLGVFYRIQRVLVFRAERGRKRAAE